MMFVIVFWIAGILPSGSLTDSNFQMILYEPRFDNIYECETYLENYREDYLDALLESIQGVTDWQGFTIEEEPECVLFDEYNMDLIENGSYGSDI